MHDTYSILTDFNGGCMWLTVHQERSFAIAQAQMGPKLVGCLLLRWIECIEVYGDTVTDITAA